MPYELAMGLSIGIIKEYTKAFKDLFDPHNPSPGTVVVPVDSVVSIDTTTMEGAIQKARERVGRFLREEDNTDQQALVFEPTMAQKVEKGFGILLEEARGARRIRSAHKHYSPDGLRSFLAQATWFLIRLYLSTRLPFTGSLRLATRIV